MNETTIILLILSATKVVAFYRGAKQRNIMYTPTHYNIVININMLFEYIIIERKWIRRTRVFRWCNRYGFRQYWFLPNNNILPVQ